MTKDLSTRTDLQGIIDDFDCILCDCDGVIWHGDAVIEGVQEALLFLRKAGKRIFFVTNNSTKSRAEYKEKFDQLGIQCAVNEVFSCAYASAWYIKNILKFPADKKIFVMGEKGIEDELDGVGIAHTGGTDPAGNVFMDGKDFSTITADPSIGAVLCGMDWRMNYNKLAKAFRYLRENEGCHFIATDLDSTFPRPGTSYPGGGATIASLMYCLERKPIVVGKPDSRMMDCILQANHLDKNRTLMVGDRIDTDMLFGATSGIATLLVLTGINNKADYEKPGAVSVPTYVVESFGNFAVLATAEK